MKKVSQVSQVIWNIVSMWYNRGVVLRWMNSKVKTQNLMSVWMDLQQYYFNFKSNALKAHKKRYQ